ncbi:MAG: hypothetical protein OXT05_15070 [Chloroflexota bacterium]|nr:hypothetical protein [Chloroflexota bacterium]
MTAKYRSIVLILGLALALLLSALPLQAENTVVLPGIGGLQFDGTASTGSKNIKWKFSWDSVPTGVTVKAQIKAASFGSFGGLWVSVDLSVSRSGGKTRVSFQAPSSNNLKVRFRVSNSAGQSTPWKSITAGSS